MNRPAILTLFSVLPLALAGAAPALAQPGGAQAQGTASAQIVEPLSVVAMGDLRFGGVAVAADQDGSVTIAPETGAATYSGGASRACSSSVPCASEAATFAVSGEAGRDYTIGLPDRVEAIPIGSAGPILLVTGLQTVSRNRPGTDLAGRLDAQGSDALQLGGTLVIPLGTRPGTYAAQVPIVVSYS